MSTFVSEEIESAVIGALLIKPECIDAVVESGLESSWFVTHKTQTIFIAIMAQFNADKPFDISTVSSIEGIDINDVTACADSFTSLIYLGSHLEDLKELHSKRQLRESCQDAIESLDLVDADESASHLSAEIEVIINGRNEVEPVTTENIIEGYISAMNGNPDSLPLPWDRLTQQSGGIKRKMVTVLTGRSKSGKSMLKGYMCRYWAEKKIAGVDFCFEDKEEIARKRIASIGKYCAAKLDSGGEYVVDGGAYRWIKSTMAEIETARKWLDYVASLPLYFEDRKMTHEKLAKRVAYYKKKYDIKYAFVDGAKDMKRPAGLHNDCGFEEEVSQAMTEIAHKYDIAMIPIHHLTKIGDSLITPDSVRGSGNIISDSRAVWALQGDRNGAGLAEYMPPPELNTNDDGYVTTRVLECIVNNHGKSARLALNTNLDKCDFWQQ